MYSKDTGITRRDTNYRRSFGGSAPIYRQNRPERVQVPPNYSGHAIVDGEERPLGSMTPAESEPLHAAPPFPSPDAPTPRFDDLPRVSGLGDPHRHATHALPATFAVRPDPTENAFAVRPDPTENAFAGEAPQTAPAASTEPPSPATASAGRPARGPSLFDSLRLPFGHGIGGEELLVLGLILLLLHEGGDCEDRGDLDETVILLGLLLLLG